jgi:SAM-dependent methyltransferase
MNNIENQKAIYGNYAGKYHGEKIGKLFNFIVGKYIKDEILDVGAGDGSLIKSLRNNGFNRIIGIDLEPRNEIVLRGDICNLNFDDNSFETITLTEVFEHLTIDQIETGLNEIKRVLRKDGHLIITVPFKENPNQNTVCCPNCKINFHRYGHEQFFNNEKDIIDILNKNKFDIVWMKPYSMGPMAAYPILKYFNFIYKKLSHLDAFSQTLFIVCKKHK